MILFGDSLLTIFEIVGIFVFATSGALMAIRKGFDAVGIVLLAEITAIGVCVHLPRRRAGARVARSAGLAPLPQLTISPP